MTSFLCFLHFPISCCGGAFLKPIIKWAGGKTQLLDELMSMMPQHFNHYYEPFFGGGALYFSLSPEEATINDYNPQLISLYKQCRDNLDALLNILDKLEFEHCNKENYYYEIRKMFNQQLQDGDLTVESAANFLYLNKAGFNGLYRLNSKGLFNVPSAKKQKIKLYDKENIKNVSKQLKKANILVGDFEKACENANKRDFVFFDSPYYNTFDTYQSGGFDKDSHLRLAALFKILTEKGVYCMLTNSNEEFIKELYQDYNTKIVSVKRMINCNPSKRTGKEIIITNY